MTPLVRALLIIVLCVISLIVFLYNRLTHKTKETRAHTLLLLLSFYYPFLDLSFTPFSIRITPFDFTLWSFIIINWDFISELKRYKVLQVLLGIMVFTSMLSEFMTDSILSIPKSFRVFVLFMVAGVTFRESSEAHYNSKHLLKLFQWPAISALCFGLIQIFIAPDFTLYYSSWSKESRISSCFLDPQIAGCCMATFAIFFLNRFLNSHNWKNLILFMFCILVGLYTGSKVFILSIAIGVVLSLLKATKISQSIIFLSLSCILLIVFSNKLEGLLIFERFNNFDSSLEGRQELYWLGALDIFQNNWFSGIGPGVFQQYVEKYNYPLVHNIDGEQVYALQPESGYLLWLDEYGIFAIIFLIIIFSLLRLKSKGNLDYRILLIPFLISFVSLYNLSSSQLAYLVAITSAALVYAYHNHTNKRVQI